MTRIMASVVEAHNDESGIKWPESIAPYRACIVTVRQRKDTDDAEAASIAQLHSAFAPVGSLRGEIVLDDRSDTNFGAKMYDAELIGYPWIIIAGKKFKDDGMLEVRNRRTGETLHLSLQDTIRLLDYDPLNNTMQSQS
jgi:prolyl-tRNA synthetase